MSRRFLSKILPALVIMVSASTMLVANDADAKRMGGGSSMGRQSNNAMQRQATTPPASTPQQNTTNRAAAPAAGAAAGAAATAGARSGMSRFMGPLMGIAAGLGLAALFSHLGMGGAMAEMFGSLLLIGLVIFAVIFLVRRFRGAGAQRNQPAFQGAAAGGNDRNPIFQKRADDVAPMARQSDAAIPASAAAAPAVSPAVMAAPPVEQALGEWTIPSDFDTSNFLQNAKAHFVKLQGVWDRGDTNEMRELVTDDLLAELGQQLAQREGVNVTEVVLLNAELLGIETVSDGHLASVRYSGMLREAPGAEAFRFEEIWNLFKSQNGGWLLAGVQQIPVTQ